MGYLWNDTVLKIVAAALALMIASATYGQDVVQEEDKITYKKKTSIDFSD